ncbi:hypothetical protein Rs2_49361 [Raphanus sativus]|nr:hypothetical protein Rs2_49361 [Raphanus sativus]
MGPFSVLSSQAFAVRDRMKKTIGRKKENETLPSRYLQEDTTLYAKTCFPRDAPHQLGACQVAYLNCIADLIGAPHFLTKYKGSYVRLALATQSDSDKWWDDIICVFFLLSY